MTRRLLLLILFVSAVCAASRAQGNDLLPEKPAANPQVPTVTFQFEFPGANPSHYALSVDSAGRAAYKSTGPQDESAAYATPGQQGSADPYLTKFTISPATTEQIFAVAKRLNYFDGKFDYTKTRVANTGAKTLIYGDTSRHFETTFNWSQNQDAMEAARIFQNLSATLEFDRRLREQMRHQKLALDAELKQVEDAAKHNNVTELRLLAPTLQKIVSDPSMLHIVRKRAQDLLAMTQP